MNIPNSLTLLRIALIPVFVVAYYLPFAWANILATGVFFVAAITDWLDGYLARSLGQISALGSFLDPVADKLMVAVVLVLLVARHPGAAVALPAAIIIGREITISALREWMAELGARSHVAVSRLGKVKTSAQMVALILMIYEQPLYGLPSLDIGFICLYLAAALTLWSMLIYLRAAWPELKSGSTSE